MTDTPKRKKRWGIIGDAARGCHLKDNISGLACWISDKRTRAALNAMDERERVGCVCTPWEWSYWLQRWVIWHGDSMYMVYQLPKGSIGCPKCLRKIRSKETS